MQRYVDAKRELVWGQKKENNQECLYLVFGYKDMCVDACSTVACQASLSVAFFQARILEWVAISFSRGSSQPRNGTRIP